MNYEKVKEIDKKLIKCYKNNKVEQIEFKIGNRRFLSHRLAQKIEQRLTKNDLGLKLNIFGDKKMAVSQVNLENRNDKKVFELGKEKAQEQLGVQLL